jgi:hypothetical protein
MMSDPKPKPAGAHTRLRPIAFLKDPRDKGHQQPGDGSGGAILALTLKSGRCGSVASQWVPLEQEHMWFVVMNDRETFSLPAYR